MKTRYYASFDMDFSQNKGQDHQLPNNYRWIHKNPLYVLISYMIYFIVLIWAFFYLKCTLHLKITKKTPQNLALKATDCSCKALKPKSGIIYYSNHTMALGDVLAPFVYSFPRRPYLVCSASNLGIPVIGKLLPLAGALPIPDTIKGLNLFNAAVKTRLEQGKTVIIYPEAHLWPYCTFIRPLKDAAFHYPAMFSPSSAPRVYTATTILHSPKSHHRRSQKPSPEIILAGPFCSNQPTRHLRQADLKRQVGDSLQKSAELGDYEYIKYIRKD